MNPINPAMDKLLFTTDGEQVFCLLEKAARGGEPWVALGAYECNGEREYLLGRVSAERIALLPALSKLYKDDLMTSLGTLIRNGVPVDPPVPDELLGLIGCGDEANAADG